MKKGLSGDWCTLLTHLLAFLLKCTALINKSVCKIVKTQLFNWYKSNYNTVFEWRSIHDLRNSAQHCFLTIKKKLVIIYQTKMTFSLFWSITFFLLLIVAPCFVNRVFSNCFFFLILKQKWIAKIYWHPIFVNISHVTKFSSLQFNNKYRFIKAVCKLIIHNLSMYITWLYGIHTHTV